MDTPDGFIRAHLIARGFNPRKIRHNIAPEGVGSAEQWVRDRFPREVQSYRIRRHENIVLIVMIDVDNHTPQQRIEQLEKALQDNELTQRDQKDRIAILTPAWCLENWFWFLQEGEVVEETSKKYTYTRNGSFLTGHKPDDFAAKMHDWCQSGQPDPPPSLKTSCAEWQRLELT